MDLIHYDEQCFRKIEKEIKKLAIDLDLHNVEAIPVSATEGDNVTLKSPNMPWYTKAPLLEYLENINVEEHQQETGFVMPVQRVCRPNHTFRGFQGEVASGKVAVGDTIMVLPSRETAEVQTILYTDKSVSRADKGQPVTIQLNREIDVSRGSVLVKDSSPIVSNMFTVSLLWMDDVELVQGKNFMLKVGTKTIPATIMSIKYKVDVHSGKHLAVKKLQKNEIAVCDIALADQVVYDTFQKNKELGNFVLIDRVTNMTSACGVIEHSLRRSENLTWQKLDITREVRAEKLGQKPVTIWFTGLSGSGKSTLANELEKVLTLQGKHTMLQDGDNIRMGLNQDLGFDEKGRIENIRRIAEVAKLMNDAGLIVLTAFISPYESDREKAREIIGAENFIEVYVNTPLEVCEERDVKGLYKKAREGKIPNFTGISSPYEEPHNPSVVIDTSKVWLEQAVEEISHKMDEFEGSI